MNFTDPLPTPTRSRNCTDIELKIAATRAERRGAFELVYRSYLQAGLCEENRHGFRVISHQLLPSTDLIVARLDGEVISTLSLVRDGALGLPMERIYAEKVARRRAAGLRLAEVSCLADRRRDPVRFFELFCEMGRFMAQLARKGSIDELLVAVHPRHAPLYCRYMAFQRMAGTRDYPTVRGNPAVALVLNFRQAEVESPTIWQRFFGEPLHDSVLQSSPIAREDRDYFRPFVDEEFYPEHLLNGASEGRCRDGELRLICA